MAFPNQTSPTPPTRSKTKTSRPRERSTTSIIWISRFDKPWIKKDRPQWHNDDWAVDDHANDPAPTDVELRTAKKTRAESGLPSGVRGGAA
ncbi:hypothetical protein LX36DRAFT_661228 [Colletotrichum falcatum]|nr:hypothetical protein LX36DRAFT_661228 [Colletotrichum falcatum]